MLNLNIGKVPLWIRQAKTFDKKQLKERDVFFKDNELGKYKKSSNDDVCVTMTVANTPDKMQIWMTLDALISAVRDGVAHILNPHVLMSKINTSLFYSPSEKEYVIDHLTESIQLGDYKEMFDNIDE